MKRNANVRVQRLLAHFPGSTALLSNVNRLTERHDVSQTEIKTGVNGTNGAYEVIIIGAGVTGICQLYHLVQLGFNVALLEACPALGGTWYNNRYPGCRFDSESYSYGYSFSREVLDEWNWSELFTSQPENLKYLEFVVEKFGLKSKMQFNTRVASAHFDESVNVWRLQDTNGNKYVTRFLITSVGSVSIPSFPRLPGMGDFKGLSFHSHDWPHTPLDLKDKKVAVIGAGPSGMQLISAIAGDVKELIVFQREANWSAPLNNAQLSASDMSEIRLRYDSIMQQCSTSPTFFIHHPDLRGFFKISREERVEMWNRLWSEPGFGIWLANFAEIFHNSQANLEFCEFVAQKIRSRVQNPALAEKLIPKTHAFGARRVVLEKNYYEAYNRSNVKLVDLNETPIKKITPSGICTSEKQYDFDIIVYATGFDSFTGGYDKIDIRGTAGQRLRDKWKDDVATFLGVQVHGFPNLFMAPGPQGAGGSINWTRAAEVIVAYITKVLEHARGHEVRRIEANLEAEQKWAKRVKAGYKFMPLLTEGALTGYNSNIEGRERGKVRHIISFLGATNYTNFLKREETSGYKSLSLS